MVQKLLNLSYKSGHLGHSLKYTLQNMSRDKYNNVLLSYDFTVYHIIILLNITITYSIF